MASSLAREAWAQLSALLCLRGACVFPLLSAKTAQDLAVLSDQVFPLALYVGSELF